MNRMASSLVVLLLAWCTLYAQQPALYFEKLTTENGLSHNKVNCIIQDHRGFIWLGTDDGLNRYDGNNFDIFRHEPGNATTISGNIITDMVEDKQGVLWIATADGGLTKYDYKLPPTRQFKQYKHIPGDTNSIPANIINTLVLDGDGYLWLGTRGQRIIRFHPKTEKFRRMQFLGTRTILDLSLDHSGNLWAGREGGGLLKIDTRTLKDTMDRRYFDLYAKLPHKAVTALYTDKEHYTWFGSWDKVLYRRKMGSDSEEVFMQTGGNYSFTNDEIDCFTEDTQGHLWMGGASMGLQIYDKKNNRFYHYPHDPAREGTIADNRINCLYTDRSGKVWVGTGKGVSIHHLQQQQFTQTFLPPAKDNTPVTIYDFYKMGNGELWIGTSEGIYVQPAPNAAIQHRPLVYKGNKLQVTRFFTDVDSTFYIGTNYSLFKYNTANHSIALLPNTEKDKVMHKIIESRVVSIVRDSIENHPVLIVSPFGHFLAYYDLTEKCWISRQDSVKKILETFNLPDNMIRKIHKSRNGKLWLATFRMGLGQWKNQAIPQVHYLSNNPVSANSISNNNIYDIADDARGNLWISTYGGGLNYFNTTTNTFTHFAATNNLLEGIQVDAAGNVWMISNGDIHKYDVLRKSYTSFELPDIEKSGGIKGNIYKDRQGRMYMAGINYFITFDPLAIRDVKLMPQVAFTDFKIFNQSFSHLLWQDKITLQYNQNYFTVSFAAPDFSTGRNVEYAYKLEGRDDDWIPVGNRNFEQFSNLPGGEYTFKVRATNNAGIWNNYAAAIRIVIIPPFWKTFWFYGICLVMAGLIIYAIYRYRINELLKRQSIRNKIAQDLHDNVGSTLSSISVYSQVAKIYNEQERTGDLQQTLDKISTTSSEMISEMSDIVWAINPRNDNMDTILQRMESYARPLLTSQGIAFHFTVDPAVKHINLEMTRRKNFYLIFKEAVNNALKYAKNKNLWVTIHVHSHQIELMVKDDGVGFDKEKVKIHASQSLSGNGLRNMEMRTAEMKGNCNVSSVPGKGTCIKLQFPIT
jgi:ligand-binding sensor domain-containing protein/two-component sensor histidine kinase